MVTVPVEPYQTRSVYDEHLVYPSVAGPSTAASGVAGFGFIWFVFFCYFNPLHSVKFVLPSRNNESTTVNKKHSTKDGNRTRTTAMATRF